MNWRIQYFRYLKLYCLQKILHLLLKMMMTRTTIFIQAITISVRKITSLMKTIEIKQNNKSDLSDSSDESDDDDKIKDLNQPQPDNEYIKKITNNLDGGDAKIF